MNKKPTYLNLRLISLNRDSPTPLNRQLYESLRQEILLGKLKSGGQVPPSRTLAADLAISRNTVSKAYNQLLAEGYLESVTGGGTFVTRTLPEAILQVEPVKSSPSQLALEIPARKPRLSERGKAITQLPYQWEKSGPQPFDSTLPAVDVFPTKIWEKLLVSTWRSLSMKEFGYQEAVGYRPLREALHTYLQTTRGVTCRPEQIIITTGAQQALSIAANLILNRGDTAWVEDPCYLGIKSALQGALANIVPISVDEQGLIVEEGIAKAPYARMVYTSPSHQYPLGVTLSLTRRAKLLEWAQDNRAWIIEDDYDSEFRFEGHPLASIQGLDQMGRVIYVGTFSKVLFPSLRIGYVVVPPALVEPFHAARAHTDRGAPLFEQAVLERFISEGHFARHVRRMRTLYAERQAVLVEMAEQFLGGLLEVTETAAGLHLVGWLPNGVDDVYISDKLREAGIIAPALSSFAINPLPRGGLVIGFAAVPVLEIPGAVKRMGEVLKKEIVNN